MSPRAADPAAELDAAEVDALVEIADWAGRPQVVYDASMALSEAYSQPGRIDAARALATCVPDMSGWPPAVRRLAVERLGTAVERVEEARRQ